MSAPPIWARKTHEPFAAGRRARGVLWREPGALSGVVPHRSGPEVVTLLGRNGMGKTTTVHAIMPDRPAWTRRDPAGGPARSIRWRPHRIARLGVGLVPEGRQIFPNLTAEENLIATASQPRGRRAALDLGPGSTGCFPGCSSARRSSMGNLLSGGEQQMLAIGRALMTNPTLLILDEATEGLAPLVRAEIWDVLARLKARGQSILVIDKNIRDLARIADRHQILEKGQIVWSGNSNDLLADPNLIGRYLGV